MEKRKLKLPLIILFLILIISILYLQKPAEVKQTITFGKEMAKLTESYLDGDISSDQAHTLASDIYLSYRDLYKSLESKALQNELDSGFARNMSSIQMYFYREAYKNGLTTQTETEEDLNKYLDKLYKDIKRLKKFKY